MAVTKSGKSREQLQGARMIGLIAASYGVDTLLIAGFGIAGTVSLWAAAAYVLAGSMHCLVFYALLSHFRLRGMEDPRLTVPSTAIAAAIQLGFLLLLPQLTFLFLMILFIVFGFSSLSLSSRNALYSWLLVTTAVIVILALGASPGAGAEWLPSRGERVLLWLCFAATLGRCILVGAFGRDLRDTLVGRHQDLKAALATLRERDVELAANRQSLEHANEELRHRATHDPLTGLPNRALFADRLSQALARALREGTKVAVLVFDLDRFKLINDSLGHGVGDDLLRQVAARLTGSIRAIDTVARAGGDEFLLIVSDPADRAVLSVVGDKILSAIGAPYSIDSVDLHTTPSIGISLFPADGDTADALLAHADEAMYVAKRHGGNTYEFFEQGMEGFSHHRLQLENDLRNAIALGQFELHYQPKIDISSGSITSVEALLRWRHPERGLVLPGEFISLAEESGLMLPIGRWVIREACRQARAWRSSALPSLRVAVNLSPVQFRQPGFLQMIRAALADHDLPPECLEIELTEGTVMNNAEGSVEILEELSRMGVVVAIDDFGTGYSSMSYLRRFPIDRLKIDKSFIRDLSRHPDDASIVQAIISLAHSLRLKVVAEGVETTQQLDHLRALGCDQYQGFLVSPAVPASEVDVLIRSRTKSIDVDPLGFNKTQSKLRAYRR